VGTYDSKIAFITKRYGKKYFDFSVSWKLFTFGGRQDKDKHYAISED